MEIHNCSNRILYDFKDSSLLKQSFSINATLKIGSVIKTTKTVQEPKSELKNIKMYSYCLKNNVFFTTWKVIGNNRSLNFQSLD